MQNIDYLRERAGKGDKECQFHLALELHRQDKIDEAKHWYELAAKKGHAFAQNNLGLLYQTGTGVLQDFDLAAQYFVLAAHAGLKEGQYNLGILLLEGKGVHQSWEEAVVWLRRSAEQGYWRAEFELGCCYQNGVGIRKDLRLAAEYFKKAVLDRPSNFNSEEVVNQRHALKRALSSVAPTAQSTATPLQSDDGNLLIERCKGLAGIPHFAEFNALRKKRIILHAREVVQSYRAALEQYGRDMLGFNRPIKGLDFEYLDFLRSVSAINVEERANTLFDKRELIYRATLEKNVEFFKRLGYFLTVDTGDKEIQLKQIQHFLLSFWIQSAAAIPPLCFFANDSLADYLQAMMRIRIDANNKAKLIDGQTIKVDAHRVSEIRKHLRLKFFTERWFHVPSVMASSDAITPVISVNPRGHAKKD